MKVEIVCLQKATKKCFLKWNLQLYLKVLLKEEKFQILFPQLVIKLHPIFQKLSKDVA